MLTRSQVQVPEKSTIKGLVTETAVTFMHQLGIQVIWNTISKAVVLGFH